MTSRRASLGSEHPTVLVVVLSAAGIGVSLMQTLIVPVIPSLPVLLGVDAPDAY